MDVLADVLRAVRLEGTAYFEAAFAAPWGMSFAGSEVANFHLVKEGRCWVTSEALSESCTLSAGDIVVFPHGSPHRLASDQTAEAMPAQQFIAETKHEEEGRLVYGGAGKHTTLICGHFSHDPTSCHPLWDALPDIIVLESGTDEIIETATQMTVSATEGPGAGASALVDRLAEILLIQIIRAYATGTEGGRGFIAALSNNAIGRLLQAIHEEPAKQWTVEEMAQRAGMSRSALTTTFQRLLEVPPMQYLTTWRMHRAKDLLRSSQLHLADVAQKVGYESEWAFAKAYKRVFGEGPGAARRNASS